jgi:hypothetical protein
LANFRVEDVILAKVLIRFLVAHHIISKEIVRTLIAWSTFVPLIVVPIVVVAVMLFGLRKISTRAVCIMNLIIASGALLILIAGESGCHSALSMSPPRLYHPPVTIREVAMDSVILVWFAGAVGLFFRKRLAWIGSVIGAGASALLFAAILVTGIQIYLYPTPETEQYGTPAQDVAGHLFAFVFLQALFSTLLAIVLRLLWGLVQMRKELFVRS